MISVCVISLACVWFCGGKNWFW